MVKFVNYIQLHSLQSLCNPSLIWTRSDNELGRERKMPKWNFKITRIFCLGKTCDFIVKTCMNSALETMEFRTGWPSGLRRWIKAPISSGAWVRIPLQSNLFFAIIVESKYQSLNIVFVSSTMNERFNDAKAETIFSWQASLNADWCIDKDVFRVAKYRNFGCKQFANSRVLNSRNDS